LGPEAKIQEWEKILQFDGTNYHHTCYSLMCLEDLMISKKHAMLPEAEEQDNQKKSEFCIKFLKNNGFAFLSNLFCTIEKRELET